MLIAGAREVRFEQVVTTSPTSRDIGSPVTSQGMGVDALITVYVTVIMMSLFRSLVLVRGKGKEAGTRLLAVFLQHICSEGNTPKGVVLPF